MKILDKVKDFMGLSDDYEEDYDEADDDAYSGQYQQPEASTPQPAVEEERRNLRNRVNGETRSASKINNVVGMPGIMNGVSEMILIEPRSFEEMPQVIDALRSRKSVILNMTLIRQEEAQRSVDFVAGGTYAIDGHYERIGDNIFLFTPNCVQVSSPGNIVNDAVDRQAPANPTARSNRTSQSTPAWNSEPMQAVQ
ncbi:MAG: cell division protein SepF [Chamaesiphon sp.]|nr:cell division protein SepF [Chamaesiphon sp.]